MMKAIDYFLDRITMYRLVLYVLIGILALAVLFSLFDVIKLSPLAIITSIIFLLCVCYVTNKFMAYAFDAPTNFESVYITALILACIITPATTFNEWALLFWAGVLSMSSKYILALNKKHIFNPAAIAVVLTYFGFGQSASWWVGISALIPFITLGGFLIIRKLKFWRLTLAFFSATIAVSLGITMLKGGNTITTLNQVLSHSSLIFLGSIMLTEPLTMPPTKSLQMVYGALVGYLTVPQVHFGTLYFTPELALSIGNVFTYIVSPKTKLFLTIREKIHIAPDIVEFIFQPEKRLSFVPGQYMEWTLSHPKPDSRGTRRYFTIASSPTEDIIRLGVKINSNGSSFKKAMISLDEKTQIIASQIAGEFTLPEDKTKNLAFIAGGIGITPFRSMVKYLIDKNEVRDITLLYINKTEQEIAYKDIFDQAQIALGIRTIYTLTDTTTIPPTWQGSVGRINKEMIMREIPDYNTRTFYLSGPFSMVTNCEQILKELGVKSEKIKKDFFPGLV